MYHVIVLFFMLKKEIEPWNFLKKYIFKIMNKPINIHKQNEIEYTYREWKQAVDAPKSSLKF